MRRRITFCVRCGANQVENGVCSACNIEPYQYYNDLASRAGLPLAQPRAATPQRVGTKKEKERKTFKVVAICLAACALLGLGGLGGAYALGMVVMQNSEAYQTAVQFAHTDRTVAYHIGEKPEIGVFNRHMSIQNNHAVVELPLEGDLDDGRVTVKMRYAYQVWIVTGAHLSPKNGSPMRIRLGKDPAIY